MMMITIIIIICGRSSDCILVTRTTARDVAVMTKTRTVLTKPAEADSSRRPLMAITHTRLDYWSRDRVLVVPLQGYPNSPPNINEDTEPFKTSTYTSISSNYRLFLYTVNIQLQSAIILHFDLSHRPIHAHTMIIPVTSTPPTHIHTNISLCIYSH